MLRDCTIYHRSSSCSKSELGGLDIIEITSHFDFIQSSSMVIPSCFSLAFPWWLVELFKYRLCVCVCVWFCKYTWKLDTSPRNTYREYFLHSPILWFGFSFFSSSSLLKSRMLSFWWSTIYPFFLLCFISFYSKESLPVQSKDSFFSASSIALAFTFRSVLHFRLIFICVRWTRNEVPVFQTGHSVVLKPFIGKTLFFLLNYLVTFVKIELTSFVRICVLTLYFFFQWELL